MEKPMTYREAYDRSWGAYEKAWALQAKAETAEQDAKQIRFDAREAYKVAELYSCDFADVANAECADPKG